MARKTPTAKQLEAIRRTLSGAKGLGSSEALFLIDALRFHLNEEHALRVAQDASGRWYHLVVKGYALDIADRIVKGEISEDDGVSGIDDAIRETIDDCQEVIYTYKAQRVVAESRNDGAYEDETGEAPPSVEAQAAWALIADVREFLGDVMADGVWSDAIAEAAKLIADCK